MGAARRSTLTSRATSTTFSLKRSSDSASPGLGREHYNLDWNCQPTHRACNRARRGQIWGFPVFPCACHWLQIEREPYGRYGLYVYYRVKPLAEPSRYLVDSDCAFVANAPPQANIGAVGTMGIAKRGITGRGYEGHSFPRLSPNEVPLFNHLERRRAMLLASRRRLRSIATIERFNARMVKMWVHYETVDNE